MRDVMKFTGAVALQEYDAARVRSWTLWSGRILSAFGVFICLSSIVAKLTHNGGYVRTWERLGYSESILTGVGLVQLSSIVLYLIPSTSVLGAVVLTGYLGGAIASWVRLGEPNPMMVPLSTCLLLWAGLYLREDRLQSLLPLRKKTAA
jgi:DoxX-like protein